MIEVLIELCLLAIFVVASWVFVDGIFDFIEERKSYEKEDRL